MRPDLVMLLTLAAWPAVGTGADDWIGLDQRPPLILGADFGEDEAGDSYRALMLDLPLGGDAGFYGYYGETELSDDEQTFDSLSLVSALWYRLNELVEVELQHFFEGNDGELEKETLGLALGLSQGRWRIRVQLEQGELLLFTRDNDSDFFDRFVPERFDTDVSAIAVALGWQDAGWYWRASYQRIDYERDLGALGRSRFAQFVVKASALAQSSLLISQTGSLLLGYADLEDDYSLQLLQDRSAIDGSYDESLVLGWQRWVSPRFAFLLAAATPLPAADGVGTTLGLRWLL